MDYIVEMNGNITSIDIRNLNNNNIILEQNIGYLEDGDQDLIVRQLEQLSNCFHSNKVESMELKMDKFIKDDEFNADEYTKENPVEINRKYLLEVIESLGNKVDEIFNFEDIFVGIDHDSVFGINKEDNTLSTYIYDKIANICENLPESELSSASYDYLINYYTYIKKDGLDKAFEVAEEAKCRRMLNPDVCEQLSKEYIRTKMPRDIDLYVLNGIFGTSVSKQLMTFADKSVELYTIGGEYGKAYDLYYQHMFFGEIDDEISKKISKRIGVKVNKLVDGKPLYEIFGPRRLNSRLFANLNFVGYNIGRKGWSDHLQYKKFKECVECLSYIDSDDRDVYFYDTLVRLYLRESKERKKISKGMEGLTEEEFEQFKNTVNEAEAMEKVDPYFYVNVMAVFAAKPKYLDEAIEFGKKVLKTNLNAEGNKCEILMKFFMAQNNFNQVIKIAKSVLSYDTIKNIEYKAEKKYNKLPDDSRYKCLDFYSGSEPILVENPRQLYIEKECAKEMLKKIQEKGVNQNIDNQFAELPPYLKEGITSIYSKLMDCYMLKNQNDEAIEVGRQAINGAFINLDLVAHFINVFDRKINVNKNINKSKKIIDIFKTKYAMTTDTYSYLIDSCVQLNELDRAFNFCMIAIEDKQINSESCINLIMNTDKNKSNYVNKQIVEALQKHEQINFDMHKLLMNYFMQQKNFDLAASLYIYYMDTMISEQLNLSDFVDKYKYFIYDSIHDLFEKCKKGDDVKKHFMYDLAYNCFKKSEYNKIRFKKDYDGRFKKCYKFDDYYDDDDKYFIYDLAYNFFKGDKDDDVEYKDDVNYKDDVKYFMYSLAYNFFKKGRDNEAIYVIRRSIDNKIFDERQTRIFEDILEKYKEKQQIGAIANFYTMIGKYNDAIDITKNIVDKDNGTNKYIFTALMRSYFLKKEQYRNQNNIMKVGQCEQLLKDTIKKAMDKLQADESAYAYTINNYVKVKQYAEAYNLFQAATDKNFEGLCQREKDLLIKKFKDKMDGYKQRYL